jgi:hypothetical protein
MASIATNSKQCVSIEGIRINEVFTISYMNGAEEKKGKKTTIVF